MKLGLSALHKLVCTMPAPTLSCLRRHFDVFLVQNMEEKYEYAQRQEYFETLLHSKHGEGVISKFLHEPGMFLYTTVPPKAFSIQ